MNVDTTVQDKSVEFLTDRKMLFRVLIALVRQIKLFGKVLRQSYVRVAKKALRMSAVYANQTNSSSQRNKNAKFGVMLVE